MFSKNYNIAKISSHKNLHFLTVSFVLFTGSEMAIVYCRPCVSAALNYSNNRDVSEELIHFLKIHPGPWPGSRALACNVRRRSGNRLREGINRV